MSTPPDFSGYGPPYRFEYSAGWLQFGGAALAVLALVGFLGLASALRGRAVDVAIDPSVLLVFAAVLPATILVHEAIHGLLAHLLGYRVTFGVDWSLPAAYAGSFNQRLSRRDNALVAAAPLVVITAVGTVALAFADGLLLVAALLALVVNTSIAVGDLYLLARLLRLPSGSVLYDVSMDEMWVYEPSTDGESLS